ncbi:MAG: c-type cytochrome [Sneathiella sp.]
MSKHRPLLAGLFILVFSGTGYEASAEMTVLDGEKLYQRKCAACHSLDHNRIGPQHRTVFGRKAGSLSGFRYTAALKQADFIWNEETLDIWLEKPPRMLPGTSMGFSLSKPAERKAVIQYLKSLGNRN